MRLSNTSDLILIACTLAGAAISFIDGLAGGAVLAAAVFLGADRFGLAADTALRVSCSAVALIIFNVMTGLPGYLNSPLIALAASGALYNVYVKMRDFGSEETK